MRFWAWIHYVMARHEPTITLTFDGRRIEWWHYRVIEACVCGQHPRSMAYASLIQAFLRNPKERPR